MKIFRSSAFLALVSMVCMAVIFSGCPLRREAKTSVNTFIQTVEPSWMAIELRDDLTDEKAWHLILDTLVKRFDIEVMEKENGYMRTAWQYKWTGMVTENYRVRATVKFKKGERKVDIKTEAEYARRQGEWLSGYDSRLVETLKTDIMGSVGRITR